MRLLWWFILGVLVPVGSRVDLTDGITFTAQLKGEAAFSTRHFT